MLMQKLDVGNEINNPTYDSNKSGKREVEIEID